MLEPFEGCIYSIHSQSLLDKKPIRFCLIHYKHPWQCSMLITLHYKHPWQCSMLITLQEIGKWFPCDLAWYVASHFLNQVHLLSKWTYLTQNLQVQNDYVLYLKVQNVKNFTQTKWPLTPVIHVARIYTREDGLAKTICQKVYVLYVHETYYYLLPLLIEHKNLYIRLCYALDSKMLVLCIYMTCKSDWGNQII